MSEEKEEKEVKRRIGGGKREEGKLGGVVAN